MSNSPKMTILFLNCVMSFMHAKKCAQMPGLTNEIAQETMVYDLPPLCSLSFALFVAIDVVLKTRYALSQLSIFFPKQNPPVSKKGAPCANSKVMTAKVFNTFN